MSIKNEKNVPLWNYLRIHFNIVAHYSMFKRPLNFKNTVDVRYNKQCAQVNTSESSRKSMDHVQGF